jgi:UrcA family protein
MAHILKLILLAGAFGTLAAGAASAQEYGRYNDNGYAYGQGPEEVIVQAPRWYQPKRTSIGAPIRDVSLSEAVRFDDLDLRSDRDVRRLEARIREHAGVLCRRLDVQYPVTVSASSRNCFQDAMADANDQVEAAIAQQRGYDDSAPAYNDDDDDNY